MPSANVEVVQANSAAFSRRDADAMLEYYAPDAVVVDRRNVGWGEFRGHEALRSYYQGLFDNASELHEDLDIVEENGNVVVAACELRGRLVDQPDGPEVTFSYAIRVTLEDGRIVALDIYEDADAATAAA